MNIDIQPTNQSLSPSQSSTAGCGVWSEFNFRGVIKHLQNISPRADVHPETFWKLRNPNIFLLKFAG
jgi:hypothetical protein